MTRAMTIAAFLVLGCVLMMSCDDDANSATGNSAQANTRSMRFLGTNGVVEILRPVVLQPEHWTIELWVYVDTLYSNYMPLLSTNVDERNTADGYSLKFETGRLYVRVATASNVAASYWATFTPPVKQWVHVAGTFDGSRGKVYINGALAADFNSLGPVYYSNARLWLGLGYHTDFGGYSPFRGMLDEVRIWDHARDASQISQSMRSTLSESAPGLVGYWNFDDTTRTDIVLDGSQYHNHGLIWGDAYRVTTTPF